MIDSKLTKPVLLAEYRTLKQQLKDAREQKLVLVGVIAVLFLGVIL